MVLRLASRLKRKMLRASKTRLGSYLVRKINKKKKDYHLHYPNNLSDLKRLLLPGDVLLVEGDFGISEWIKVFSSHTWSHCGLYVGNQSRLVATLPQQFVTDNRPNLVEALIGKGIILTHTKKYQHCNLRICRPKNLSWKQKEAVVRFVLDRVGFSYDQENVLQFASLPFNPQLRPDHNIGDPDEKRYTCSSLLAQAFAKVGLEVLHFYDKETAKLVPYHDSQIQPKDFDLSPNFEIIKVHPATYRKPAGLFRSLLGRKSA